MLLVALTFFLAVSRWEKCESSGQECAPACHLFCQDGCVKAPLAEPQPAPAPDRGPIATFAYLESAPGYPAFPPELPPPRR